MKALTPYVFRTGAIVPEDSVNGNLRRAATDINRNLGKRFTRMPPIVIPLDGVVDTDATLLRSVTFDLPTSTNPVDIIKVEFFIYASTGATWTLSATITGGATWDSISLATAGAATEAYAVSAQPIAVPSGGVSFKVTASAGSTIVRGWIVLHCRADRGVQGSSPSHAGYTPTFVDASTSSAGSVLDTQLTSIATAVTNDSANNKDLRCVCFLARAFSAAQSWNLPSGTGMTGLKWRAYICATAADEYEIGGTLTGAVLTGTGTGNLVTKTDDVSSTADNPTGTADDVLVQFHSIVGTVDLAYAFLWWS